MDNDSHIVTSIRVVVHSTGAWPNQMSDNHWSIYLLFGHGAGSVHVNMTAEDEDDVKGTLKLRSLTYSLTTSQIRYWDFEAAPGVTVGSIVKLIKRNGRDKYEFSGGGSGCRYWIYTVINDLAEKHLESKNAASNLWPDLLFQYSSKAEQKPLHMVYGKFNSSGVTSSSASTGASSSTSSTTTVQVKGYVVSGEHCYSWIQNGVKESSYAREWISVEWAGGVKGLQHKGKNLVSRLP